MRHKTVSDGKGGTKTETETEEIVDFDFRVSSTCYLKMAMVSDQLD